MFILLFWLLCSCHLQDRISVLQPWYCRPCSLSRLQWWQYAFVLCVRRSGWQQGGVEYFVCMTCMWCQQGVFSCNLHASSPACCVLRHERMQQNSEWVRNCQSENYAILFCVFSCMTHPQDRVKRKLYVLTQNNFMRLLLDVKQKKNKKRTFRGKNRW